MKLPTFDQAAAALDALGRVTGNPAIGAASGLARIVIDIFDGDPVQKAKLEDKAEAALKRAGASLDRLDDAITEAKARQ